MDLIEKVLIALIAVVVATIVFYVAFMGLGALQTGGQL